MTAAKGTILVTGASGGLGSAITQQVASKPEFSSYHGLYTVRDLTRADALASLGTTHPHELLALDLTKLDDVRRVAGEINTRVSAGQLPPIRALILNAGFQDFGKQSWTADGLDTTFAVNYLGHWLLALLLLKSMDKEEGTKDPRNAATHAFDEPQYKTLVSDAARFDAVARGTWCPASEDPSWKSGFRRYAASKLCLVSMQHELQARLDGDPALSKIRVLGVDPGTMMSGLQRLAPWVIRVLIFKVVYPAVLFLNPDGESVRPTSRSAAEVLEAAMAETVGDGGKLPKGGYFYARTPRETSEESRDPEKRALVWSSTVALMDLKEGETALARWQ
ncbi:putative short-chain dehydrogenase [Hypoxylon sp. FL1284]|nr:putative short-chain dehydrogenase [Hypoxylon sp. FL1284]